MTYLKITKYKDTITVDSNGNKRDLAEAIAVTMLNNEILATIIQASVEVYLLEKQQDHVK